MCLVFSKICSVLGSLLARRIVVTLRLITSLVGFQVYWCATGSKSIEAVWPFDAIHGPIVAEPFAVHHRQTLFFLESSSFVISENLVGVDERLQVEHP